MTNLMSETEQTARRRVETSPALSAYADIVLNDEWMGDEAHIDWVATAPEGDILSWAQEIRRGLEELAQ